MPSTSAKQANFMRAVSHSPKFAKKVGVSQKVGKDFEMADKKKASPLGSMKDIVDRGNRTPYEPTPQTGPDGARKSLGTMGKKGYAKGGNAKGKMPTAKDMGGMNMKCGGKAKKGYAKGGAIDGVAKRGKTRCKGAM
jgi:hypothetical protein